MSDVILKLDNLQKHFRSHWTFRPIEALKQASLEVYRGESFGFLGHNGAGKTTAIKCIVGLIHKTGGNILFEGKELTSAEQRKQLGYLPEQPYFYDHLTVEETLDFFARLHGFKNPQRKQLVQSTLERVGLEDRLKSSVRALSKGLQQRLGFAQAIINSPTLLLLDEPFSGLDPIGRHDMRNLIMSLKQEGTTIFMSSHILSDVEYICDRVSIMSQGELKKVFSLRESKQLFGQTYQLSVCLAEHSDDFHENLLQLTSSYAIDKVVAGTLYRCHFDDYDAAQAAISLSVAAGAVIEQFESQGLSLEDIFINVTGGALPKLKKSSKQSETKELELR